ncbi:hypothetical protein [Streptomyces fuscichromogenes]|uniref:Uncharacterized protein n=1 Tax=Streptomyces fuscichromogenes TaxID=1324013 RepID=A0A918CUY8_9ACTN|nr:hypothetical protein [Streptomyces fuscichromogenes]GGN31987.1 hypothetical protein GCM10011578_070340 [Streptomyces fuscichromogenes]
MVNRLAARNHQEGTGGPFVALVVETQTGRIRSAGVNLVLASGLSLARSATAAGTPMREDWIEPFGQRGIEILTDVLRNEAVDALRAHGERPDIVVHNARGRGSINAPA